MWVISTPAASPAVEALSGLGGAIKSGALTDVP